MILLIKNGNIVTLNKNNEIFTKDIVIENGIIKKIVNNYDGIYDKIIDAKNMIVMPGLINAHTHLGMSIFRNTNKDKSLQDWLNNVWSSENKLTEEDIYYTTMYSLIEMIKTGTTCCADFYIKTSKAINAILETKFRCVFTETFMDINNDFPKQLKIFEDYLNNNNNNKLITFSVNPHSLYTCSDTVLNKVQELSKKNNLLIHTHFCENINEVNIIKEKFNDDPINVLEKFKFLESPLLLAHCTYLNNNLLNKLKKENISIVHNIYSNLCLGCGFAPIAEYYNKGINICLGTDGVGSSYNLNMFSTMNMTSLVQKGLYKNPSIIKDLDVLKMATINGAKALNINSGSIEINKNADIIILDLSKTSIYPTNDLISQLVHNISEENILYNIINGKIIMDNKKIKINIDENILKEKINKIIEKVGINNEKRN